MGLWHHENGTWPQDDARKAKKNAKSLEKYFWRCYHHWDVHVWDVKVFRVTIDDHWPLIIHLDLSWRRAEQSCNSFAQLKSNWWYTESIKNLGCMRSCLKSLNQRPGKRVLMGFLVPSTHTYINLMYFSGSTMRWGTFGQLFSISSFCSNSWSNAHRRLHHPQERCN